MNQVANQVVAYLLSGLFKVQPLIPVVDMVAEGQIFLPICVIILHKFNMTDDVGTFCTFYQKCCRGTTVVKHCRCSAEALPSKACCGSTAIY